MFINRLLLIGFNLTFNSFILFFLSVPLNSLNFNNFEFYLSTFAFINNWLNRFLWFSISVVTIFVLSVLFILSIFLSSHIPPIFSNYNVFMKNFDILSRSTSTMVKIDRLTPASNNWIFFIRRYRSIDNIDTLIFDTWF